MAASIAKAHRGAVDLRLARPSAAAIADVRGERTSVSYLARIFR